MLLVKQTFEKSIRFKCIQVTELAVPSCPAISKEGVLTPSIIYLPPRKSDLSKGKDTPREKEVRCSKESLVRWSSNF